MNGMNSEINTTQYTGMKSKNIFYFIFKKHSMDTEQFLLIICYLHLKCVHLSLINVSMAVFFLIKIIKFLTLNKTKRNASWKYRCFQ